MKRLEGKVACITGAARGIGREIASRLSEEGADIIAVDIAGPVRPTSYSPAGRSDLDETAALVESHGAQVLTCIADVREPRQLSAAVNEGLEKFGRINVVAANAGISTTGSAMDIPQDEWTDVIDVNLAGVWNTIRAVVPSMIAAGEGGSIVMTSSISGLKGTPLAAHYVASKHGVVGLMRAFANELAQHNIRVNTVNPTGVDTEMANNAKFWDQLEARPDLAASYANALEVTLIEPLDIANAVLWLASDEARYVTGVPLPVDAGAAVR